MATLTSGLLLLCLVIARVRCQNDRFMGLVGVVWGQVHPSSSRPHDQAAAVKIRYEFVRQSSYCAFVCCLMVAQMFRKRPKTSVRSDVWRDTPLCALGPY